MTTKVISLAVITGLPALGVVIHAPFLAGFCVLVFLLGYAFSPRGYLVSERLLIVKRPIGTVNIPLDGIREVRLATPADMRGCIRLFGSGGLFGYYGLFWTAKLGKSTWYVTNRKKSVILANATRTVVVSPNDPEAFVSTVRLAVPLPENNALLDAAYLSPDKSRWCLIGAVIGLTGLAVAAGMMLYSPGPPKYTLTPDGLEIHDRFYPITVKASEIDVGSVRIVNITNDNEWRLVRRTNGFANRYYRAGWFRVANGKTVRMYCAGGRRLVLLPPKASGAPVLMEVTRPEEFLRELRRAWSKSS
jgi:hypothetical protein